MEDVQMETFLLTYMAYIFYAGCLQQAEGRMCML